MFWKGREWLRRIELDRSGRKLTGNKVWGHIIKEEWEKTTFSEFSWVYYYPCVNLVATINSIMEGMYFTRECMAEKNNPMAQAKQRTSPQGPKGNSTDNMNNSEGPFIDLFLSCHCTRTLKFYP